MIYTALILGFAGSLHCIGMCSPLAMAVTNLTPAVILNRLLYNGGRILMYGLLGGIVASTGMAFTFTKYQFVLSAVLGVALLLIGFTGISGVKIPVLTNLLVRFNAALKKLFAVFLQKKSYASIFMMGLFNGLLPCGLTFLALTFCLTLAGPLDGFQFMLLFGSGTLPAMLGLPAIIQFATKRFHISLKVFSTTMLILAGVLLIARVVLVHVPDSVHQHVIDIVLCR